MLGCPCLWSQLGNRGALLALVLTALPCLVLCRRKEPGRLEKRSERRWQAQGSPTWVSRAWKARRLILGFLQDQMHVAEADVLDGSIRRESMGGEPGLDDVKPRILQPVFLPGVTSSS